MKYVIAFAASIFVAISSAVAEPLVLGTTKGSANYQTGLALSTIRRIIVEQKVI